jgi:dTDP-glucose pyrophosphorylase
MQAARVDQPTRLYGNRRIDAQGDVPIGAVIQVILRQGMAVESVRFQKGHYVDMGTPDGLAKAFDIHDDLD